MPTLKVIASFLPSAPPLALSAPPILMPAYTSHNICLQLQGLSHPPKQGTRTRMRETESKAATDTFLGNQEDRFPSCLVLLALVLTCMLLSLPLSCYTDTVTRTHKERGLLVLSLSGAQIQDAARNHLFLFPFR